MESPDGDQHAPLLADYDDEADAGGVPDGMQLTEQPVLVADQHDGTTGSATILNRRRGSSETAVCWQHSQALFLKRSKYFSRDKKTWCCQVKTVHLLCRVRIGVNAM